MQTRKKEYVLHIRQQFFNYLTSKTTVSFKWSKEFLHCFLNSVYGKSLSTGGSDAENSYRGELKYIYHN